MSYLYAPIAGIVVLLLNLVAPVLALLALPFIQWDSAPSQHPARTAGEPVTAVWGDLPWFLSWLQTPDQRLPGDLNIPEVKSMYDSYGQYFASWVWIGIRNPLMGLAAWLGSKTSDYAPEDVDGLWTRTDRFGTIWRYTLSIGRLRIITGYNVYALLDGSFQAAPVFTAKIK